MATQTETDELTPGDGVHVSARRWQDRNGNTYHTVRVTLFRESGDVEKYGNADPVYGYGNAWERTALSLLVEVGAIPHQKPKSIPSLSRYMRERGIAYGTEVLDVQRKKDLHDNTRAGVTAIA
jgi:hypothetical protein